MRRIRIKKNSKRKIRIKRSRAPRRVTASRERLRAPGTRKSLAKAARNGRSKPRKGRKIVVRKRQRSITRRFAVKRRRRSRREIYVLSAEGYRLVSDASPRQAKRSSQHLIAINRFLRKDDTEPLEQFRGRRIAGIELLTDLKRIREFADADEVKLDGLYRDQRGNGRRK
jgi:hypothetical protein